MHYHVSKKNWSKQIYSKSESSHQTIIRASNTLTKKAVRRNYKPTKQAYKEKNRNNITSVFLRLSQIKSIIARQRKEKVSRRLSKGNAAKMKEAPGNVRKRVKRRLSRPRAEYLDYENRYRTKRTTTKTTPYETAN